MFERNVIFMVGHDAQGAFGLIFNKPTSSVPRGRVFEGLGISAAEGTGDFTIFYGGPASPNTGFVIHDGSLDVDVTRRFVKDVAVSDQKFIVEALARGVGPIAIFLSWDTPGGRRDNSSRNCAVATG